MSKTIARSGGTSAAKGVCPLPHLSSWVRERGGPECAFAAILDNCGLAVARLAGRSREPSWLGICADD